MNKILLSLLLLLITVISVEIQYANAVEIGDTITNDDLINLLVNGTYSDYMQRDVDSMTFIPTEEYQNFLDNNMLAPEEYQNYLDNVNSQQHNSYPDGEYQDSQVLWETLNATSIGHWGEHNGKNIGKWIITDELDSDGFPIYKPYIKTENNDVLKIESGYTSFIIDKISCDLKLFEGGLITETSKKTIENDEFLVRHSIDMSDVWVNSPTNNVECFVDYIEENDEINITTTREDSNGKFIVKYFFNNVSLKQQSEYTNYVENNSKFGFIQNIKVPRNLTINGLYVDLLDYNNLYLERDWIEANNATIFKITNDMQYDMDIGYDQLWGIGISADSSSNFAIITLDYVYQSEPLLIGQTLILDPTYVFGSPVSGSVTNGGGWRDGCYGVTSQDIADSMDGTYITGVKPVSAVGAEGIDVDHGGSGSSTHNYCIINYDLASGGEYVHGIRSVYSGANRNVYSDPNSECEAEVYYSTNSGSSWTLIQQLPINYLSNGSSCFDTLHYAHRYIFSADQSVAVSGITDIKYVVEAYRGSHMIHDAMVQRIQIVAPSAPQSLSTSQSVANQIVLSYSAPSDDGGETPTNYQVFLNGTLIDTIGNVLTYTDSISGGEIGSLLEYETRAVNSAGASVDSNTSTITSWNVPDQVTGLSVTSGTNPSMTWSSPSSDGTLTNYKIYRDSSLHDTISSSGTSYTDSTSLSSGTTYSYQIAGVSAVGTGTLSSSVNGIAGTPADPPTNVQAVISDPNNSPLAVTVTYTNPTDVGTGTLTGFQLLRNGTAVSTVGLTNTMSDTAPSGGNVFTYTVKSLSSHGTGTASSGSSVTTPNSPDQVTGLTVTPVSTSRIDLSWNTPSDNNSLISQYKVQISSNGGSSYSDVLTGNVNTVYQALSLNGNAQYHFKVSAINAVGTGTASDVKNTYTMTTTPASLSATSVSQVQINLAWGNSTGATGYKIEYESPVDNGFTTLVNNTGNTDLTRSITSLTTGTQYNFKVSGWNNGGTSVASPEASAYTWGILQAPVIDTITRLSPTSLKVDWTTGTGLPVATGYKIERQLGTGWTILANNTGTTDVTYTDSTLSSDQSATYRLYAINTIGTSPVSNEKSSDAIASSGGGGGSSSSNAVSSQTGVSKLVDLTYIDQIHRVVLGQLLSKSINVAWDSSDNLEVKSIVVSDSPFRIVFQDVPFVLLGDPSGISNGKINYSVQIPNELCTAQGQINCVEQRQYDIPVEIKTDYKGSTLTKSSVIKIDLAGGSDVPLVFVLLAIGAVPLAFIIRKVGSGKSRRKASGSSHKSSKNGSNSKKVSL